LRTYDFEWGAAGGARARAQGTAAPLPSLWRRPWRVILITRFCKLLTTVAILSRGHVSQVPQWHEASVPPLKEKGSGAI